MRVFPRVVVSFILAFSECWAFMPGAFAIADFRKAHVDLAGRLGLLCCWALLRAHPRALHKRWFSKNGWLWLGPVVVMPVRFFMIFGRDVGR